MKRRLLAIVAMLAILTPFAGDAGARSYPGTPKPLLCYDYTITWIEVGTVYKAIPIRAWYEQDEAHVTHWHTSQILKRNPNGTWTLLWPSYEAFCGVVS